ncbi:hypothetical protein KKA53_03625 [Candidatus Dependentiae bacterium]|nr:hypothetical protein [Candidatus Dependentiae bacterium]
MNFRHVALLAVIPVLLVCFVGNLAGADPQISNGKSIAAYGADGAYLVTESKELYVWSPTLEKWQRAMIMTPEIRQMDSLTDGTKLFGTDDSDNVWMWDGVSPGGSWSETRPGKTYHWVMYDPVTDESKGLIKALENVWESWDKPSGGGWNNYLPAGPEGSARMATLLLVDTTSTEFHRWQRGDAGYRVSLNRSGQTTPFKIFAYTDNSVAKNPPFESGTDNYVLERMIDAPTPTPWLDPGLTVKNPDLVLAKQISYDEDEQNLWCVDENGWPWRWSNEYQGWILSRNRTALPLVEEDGGLPCCDIARLLRCTDDFYVRTTYIAGDYSPVVIIFKDTMIMHLIVGELSKANMKDVKFYVFEAKAPDHNYHNILRLPKETPQKLVRVDGNVVRKRENHYLERLLIENGIVARPEDINLFPAEHRLIRR